MNEPRLKPRKRIRVDRSSSNSTIHDDGHGWAVSYADLLMVLLSFFVVFFSVDGANREDLFDQIRAGVQAAAPEPAGDVRRPAGTITKARLPDGVKATIDGMAGMYVDRSSDERNLSIMFADNLYRPGPVEMPPVERAKLTTVLERLKPFQKDVNIVFIGHTDDKAVTVSRSRYLRDNFALSSLRAVTALQYAVSSGMDPSRMYTKGVAEHARGNRTLSLLITPREAE